MTKDTALDLSLEALRSAAAELYRASSYCNTYEVLGNTNDAITAIQQARSAQPAQQEPVGTYGEIFESMRFLLRSGRQADQQIYMSMQHKPLYTTPPAQPAPVQKRTNYAVHLHHCNIGECEGVCKYGDDDCPALEHADMKAKWDRSTPPAANRQWVGLTDDEISTIESEVLMRGEGYPEVFSAIEAKLKELNT